MANSKRTKKGGRSPGAIRSVSVNATLDTAGNFELIAAPAAGQAVAIKRVSYRSIVAPAGACLHTIRNGAAGDVLCTFDPGVVTGLAWGQDMLVSSATALSITIAAAPGTCDVIVDADIVESKGT